MSTTTAAMIPTLTAAQDGDNAIARARALTDGEFIAADWARTVARHMHYRRGQYMREATYGNVTEVTKESLRVLLRGRDWFLTRETGPDGSTPCLRLSVDQHETTAPILLTEEDDDPWKACVPTAAERTMTALMRDLGAVMGTMVRAPEPADVVRMLREPTQTVLEEDGSVLLTQGEMQARLSRDGRGYRVDCLTEGTSWDEPRPSDALHLLGLALCDQPHHTIVRF